MQNSSSAAVLQQPDEQLAQLQQAIHKARSEVDGAAQQVAQSRERIEAIKHAGPNLAAHVHDRIAEIMREVDGCIADLAADAKAIEEASALSQQSLHGKMQKLTDLAHQLGHGFAELQQHVTGATQAMEHDMQAFSDSSSQSVSKAQALIQTFSQQAQAAGQTSLAHLTTAANRIGEETQQWAQHTGQQMEAQVHARLSETRDRTKLHFEQLTQQFTEQIQHLGDGLNQRVRGVWQRFSSEQQGRLSHLTETMRDVGQGVERVISDIETLGKSATTSTQTVVDDIDGINVGFKVTIGTLENVQDTLKEIQL